ncbi:hypothetical protein MAE02_53800 [Microvirga aerophila]|uniref:Uncharacterized protein n=1 Tax=Microvirga aerophila TaxID=670291 RepID=A0A512C0E6_9HYPH|nr:hypothetical protein MAE02_53800 [Microvirga aerophila]
MQTGIRLTLRPNSATLLTAEKASSLSRLMPRLGSDGSEIRPRPKWHLGSLVLQTMVLSRRNRSR